MSEKTDLEKMPDSLLDRMFDERTTDEVVADIIASDPTKHSVPLAERQRRAKEQATAVFDEVDLAEEARIRSVGGDPYEMLPGNKPRYTVDGEGNVKDHETGMVYISPPPGQITGEAHGADGVEQDDAGAKAGVEQTRAGEAEVPEVTVRDDGELTQEAVGTPAVGEADHHSECEHDFGEDPQDQTPCAKCGITFEDWANL